MLNIDERIKKITKAYNDYMARKSAKNRLNLLRAKKKYADLAQYELTTLRVNETPLAQYKSDRKTFKPKQGGLMTNLTLRARDLMIRDIKQEEKEARQIIASKLLSYNYKKDYLRELKINQQITTKKGEKRTVKDILQEALLRKAKIFEAKKKLRDKNISNIIEEEMSSTEKRASSMKERWETQRAGLGIGPVIGNLGTKRNKMAREAKSQWRKVTAGINTGYDTSSQSVIKGFRERMLRQLIETSEERNREIEVEKRWEYLNRNGFTEKSMREIDLRIDNGPQGLDLSNKASVDDFMSLQLQELEEVERQLKKEAQGEILDKMKKMVNKRQGIIQEQLKKEAQGEILDKMDKMANKRNDLVQKTYVVPVRPNWATIANQAAQSGLERMDELEGKIGVASYLAQEAVPTYERQNPFNYQVAVVPQQPLLGRRGTLAQKLGLEERLSSSLFSSPQQKNSSMSLLQAMARRRLGLDKYDWEKEMVGVRGRIAQRGSAPILQAMIRRRLATGGYNDVQQLGGILRNMATTLPSFNLEPNMGENNYIIPNIEAPINQQMPRYAKGSSEARDFMARMRGLKKPRRDTSFLKTGQFDASTAPLTKYNVRRPRGRPRKTRVRAAEEIQTYMARAGFGVARPKITRTYTRKAPATIPTSIAPKRVGRPRKMTGSRPATDSEAQAAFAAGRIGPSFAKQASKMRALMASNPGMSLRAAALSTYRAPRASRAKAPKTRQTYAKVLMSVPRAVSTGNGAAKRRGRPNKLTTDTARVVKDVLKLQGVRRLRGG